VLVEVEALSDGEEGGTVDVGAEVSEAAVAAAEDEPGNQPSLGELKGMTHPIDPLDACTTPVRRY